MFENLKKVLCLALLLAGLAGASRAQLANPVTNAGTTGTTLNALAKLNTSNQAVIATTSDTTMPVYIVVGGNGTAGVAQLGAIGQFLCTMDATNASFASQPVYVIASTTTGGDCHAQTTAPAAGTWVVGFLAAPSTTSGSTALVQVNGGFAIPATGSGSAWSALTNATASLSLTNTGFNSTFTQAAGDVWNWQNTASTSSGTVAQNSPSQKLCGEYYNGTADAADCWALQDQVGTGTNGQSLLVLTHSGSGNSFNGIKFGASENSQITNTGNFNLNINTAGSGQLNLGTGSSASPVKVNNGLVQALSVLTFSATPTLNLGNFNTFEMTLTANVTSVTLSNATTGESFNVIWCQDATGSRTLAYGAVFHGATTIGSTASKCSVQRFAYDGTNAYAVTPGVTNQ